MRTFTNIAGFLAGLVGGAGFLILFFLIQFSLLPSLLLGLAAFGGAYMFLYAFRPKPRIQFDIGMGITPELLETTMKEGGDKVKALIDCSKDIKDPAIRAKIARIIEVIKSIFANFEKDPKDIKQAKQFLSYYLDTSIKIVRKYRDLSGQNVRSPEIAATLTKAELMLDSIEKAFEKQHARLLRDDAMDLDTEIQTLEKTFNAEDLK
ncbi:MAG TPA: 5-bromo-4-chloroindolyl phosphate hydrolysis family protein [Puia sp.]|nr:5-bromo-4-chloroindolyl phosphate hydrolysis family protein [Puia sp.]